jgi:hypothetical protein
LDPANREGFGFVLFETAEQGLRSTPPACNWQTPGVTIIGRYLREIAWERKHESRMLLLT